MKSKIRQHEEKYWHIPKFKIGLIALFLLIIAIDIGFSFIFINEWKKHNISFVITCFSEECLDTSYIPLGFIPTLFFTYFLISITFIILVGIIRGGLNKLKSFDEEGLIYGLIVGLICGLIFGLIYGLIGGLIYGLIYGLILGLILGLIVGLIGGLIGELKESAR